MPIHIPPTLQELKTKRKPIRNINIEHRERLTSLEKLAVFVTERVGTMGFFFLIAAWTILWVAWNSLAPSEIRFDPFPAFVLWLFVSNMIQLMLMPLIMVGQNLQSKHSRARSEADYEVSVRAETEIEAIIEHLENQNELISKVLNRLEKKE